MTRIIRYRYNPGPGFVEEGFTPEHFWFEGRSWGVYRLALYRDRWSEVRERVADLLQVREQFDRLTAEP